MVIACSAVGERHWALVDAVKAYRSTRALDGVSLTLTPGTTVLLGRNGAGKSTLIRCLAGVEQLTSGAVNHDSEAITSPGQWRVTYRRLGWLPQSFVAPSRMRGEEVVAYAGWLKELPERELAQATV